MVAGMMGMHASFTISDETMALCNELKPEGVGYHIHVAEGIYDLHQCLKEHGKRIVDRLYDWNILGPKTLLGHCIYINEHEMDLIKDTDTMVVHNPESNMGDWNILGPKTLLGHCIYINEHEMDLIKDTDTMVVHNPESNMGHKHHLCDPNAAWGEVPKMLFEGNREIAGRYFEKPLGILKKGAAADVIVLDYDPLTPMRADNVNGHLMFGTNGNNVVTTVCNGKMLMKDREILVWKMLFEGNREIAGRYFEKPLGILKKGAAADVIVLDYDPLTPMRADNVNGPLMFGTNGNNVVTTVCTGKMLMKDREILVCDAEKVMADCRQAAKELADDINSGK